MQDFDETDPQSIVDFVTSNLPKHDYFALGTTDADKNPWVVCLRLSYDSDATIIWKSKLDTEHTRHLQLNNTVSICVFSKSKDVGDFGFYTQATARELTDPSEIEYFMKIRYKGREMPGIAELSGDGDSRLYVATIDKAWVNGERHLKVPVDLDLLRQSLAR